MKLQEHPPMSAYTMSSPWFGFWCFVSFCAGMIVPVLYGVMK